MHKEVQNEVTNPSKDEQQRMAQIRRVQDENVLDFGS